jgi:hypothetical protein
VRGEGVVGMNHEREEVDCGEVAGDTAATGVLLGRQRAGLKGVTFTSVCTFARSIPASPYISRN